MRRVEGDGEGGRLQQGWVVIVVRTIWSSLEKSQSAGEHGYTSPRSTASSLGRQEEQPLPSDAHLAGARSPRPGGRTCQSQRPLQSAGARGTRSGRTTTTTRMFFLLRLAGSRGPTYEGVASECGVSRKLQMRAGPIDDEAESLFPWVAATGDGSDGPGVGQWRRLRSYVLLRAGQPLPLGVELGDA